jgi:hypothetical protein
VLELLTGVATSHEDVAMFGNEGWVSIPVPSGPAEIQQSPQDRKLLEVLGPPRRLLGPNDVHEGGDGNGHILELEEHVIRPQLLEPFGAARTKGEIEVPEPRGQIEQLHPGEKRPIWIEWNALWHAIGADASVHLDQSRGKPVEVS